ncbi:hypothetical protein IWQ61_010673, partial [Dispira simplex]
GDKKLIWLPTQDSIPIDFQHQSLAHAEDANDTNQAYSPLTQSLEGKVALIQWDGCKVNTKTQHAVEARAITVLSYNTEGDIVNPFTVNDTIKILVVCIEKSSGDDFIKWLDKDQTIALSADESLTTIASAHPTAVSSFSSWGPLMYLKMKPDIMALGSQIYSTLCGKTTSKE